MFICLSKAQSTERPDKGNNIKQRSRGGARALAVIRSGYALSLSVSDCINEWGRR